MTEAARVYQAFVGAKPHFASLLRIQLSVAHAKPAAFEVLAGPDTRAEHHHSQQKNKFLPLPSQRFQVF
jgi:hypothetical protein